MNCTSEAGSESSMQTAIDTMDSNEDSGLKTVKVPSFDGTESKFQMWFVRFTTFALLNKFAQAVKPDIEPGMPPKEEEEADDTAVQMTLLCR